MSFKSLDLPRLLLNLDLRIYKKYPSRILFSLFQIFLMIFLFYFISETVGEVALLKMDYFPFVATGLCFQYFYSGVVNAASEKIQDYRDYGVLEEILFGRFPSWWVLLSAGFQEILMAIGKAMLLFLAVAFVFHLEINFFLLILSLLLGFCLGLSLSFVACCSFLLWKRFSLLELGGSLVTLFLSGIYFPVSVLPAGIQIIAKANPLLHSLNLFRRSLGIETPGSTYESLFIIGLYILLIGLFNFFLYQFCLKKIKSDGISDHF